MRAAIVAAAWALAACGDRPASVTITLVQYDDREVPMIGPGVRVYLGDVSNGGSAEIRIQRADGSVIAAAQVAERDQFPFTHDGRGFVLTAIDYVDNWIGDEARLRIERRAAGNQPARLRVPQRTSARLLPGVEVGIGDIEQSMRTELTITAGGVDLVAPRTVGAGDVIAFTHEGRRYRLTVQAFEGHATTEDFALLLLEIV